LKFAKLLYKQWLTSTPELKSNSPIFIFVVLKYTVVTAVRSQNTCLNLATIHGHLEICKLLVAAKADLCEGADCEHLWCAIVSQYFISLTVIAEAARLLFNSPLKMESPVLLNICAASRRRAELVALYRCGNTVTDHAKYTSLFVFQSTNNCI
jgi:hypothetical protein